MESTKERSVEEIVEEFINKMTKHLLWRDSANRLLEKRLRGLLTQTLQAERQKRDQELQKARHDWLRDEIVKLEGMKTHFVPADNEWFGKEDYSEGEFKLVPAKDPSNPMHCLTCRRFLYEEGCNCGTIELQTIIDRYLSELDQPLSQDNK